MPDGKEDTVSRQAVAIKCGSIVAAAGCGKTEQIARAVALSHRRRLVLTHTHAGVDAITKRLERHAVSPQKYRVDTIAGWCLRFASAFPKRSGVDVGIPTSTEGWNVVYEAAARLIEGEAAHAVIDASYGGLFVDEYQDCTHRQHAVIKLLARQLPTCIFGDPLQAIFDFHDSPVNWAADVFPAFPRACELTTPWRWRNAGNNELAEWLAALRSELEGGGIIDLTTAPTCVKWAALPDARDKRQKEIYKGCLAAMVRAGSGSLIVIGDSANTNARTLLARSLATQGFSNVEPMNCKELAAAAEKIQSSTGMARFETVLDFASKCMTGTENADLKKSIQARAKGGRLSQKKFGELFPVTDKMIQTGSDEAISAFLTAMRDRPKTYLYRREMFHAMSAALRIKIARNGCSRFFFT